MAAGNGAVFFETGRTGNGRMGAADAETDEGRRTTPGFHKLFKREKSCKVENHGLDKHARPRHYDILYYLHCCVAETRPLQCMHLTLTQSFITAYANANAGEQTDGGGAATAGAEVAALAAGVFGGKYCRYYVASHDDVQIWQQVEDPEVYYLEWSTLKLLINADEVLIQTILGVGPAAPAPLLPPGALGPLGAGGGILNAICCNNSNIMWSDTGPIYCGQDAVSVEFNSGWWCLHGRAANTTAAISYHFNPLLFNET